MSIVLLIKFLLFTALNKSGSESSISEACDSVKESSKRYEAERDDCSDKEDERKKDTSVNNELELPRDLMSKRGSLTSAKSLHEFKHEQDKSPAPSISTPKTRCSSHKTIEPGCPICVASPATNASPKKNPSEDEASCKGRGIRPSKSDTSLTESFVVVDGEYNKKKYQNSLREGDFLHLLLREF